MFSLLGDSVTPGKPILQDSGRRCRLLNGKHAVESGFKPLSEPLYCSI